MTEPEYPAPEYVPGPQRALARVELGAIERNCAHLKTLLGEDPRGGGAELCAVVKADAYGHGETECARAALAGGAGWLAVAAAEEAVSLRSSGIDVPVLVMGALTTAELGAALAVAADVVAWDRRFVREVSEQSRRAGGRARLHVKLDTGMGRLGTSTATEALELVEAVASDDALELVGVMTHFATADEPGDDYFPAQLTAFRQFVEDVRAAHPGTIAHAANSAATYRDPAAHFDMARCGIAVYGLDPMNQDPTARQLEPALSLHSYVALVKRFEAGQSAGYGRRWRASDPTWVGVLPIGYGDGVRRGLSNNAEVLVRGRRYPLVGTVSMDNVTIDLGADTDVEAGDEAMLIGPQAGERILCEEVAHRLDTINYEVTCGLSARVRRDHRPA